MISPRLARAVRGGQALALAGLVAYVLHATGVVYADADWLFDDWVYNGLLVVVSIG